MFKKNIFLGVRIHSTIEDEALFFPGLVTGKNFQYKGELFGWEKCEGALCASMVFGDKFSKDVWEKTLKPQLETAPGLGFSSVILYEKEIPGEERDEHSFDSHAQLVVSEEPWPKKLRRLSFDFAPCEEE